MQVVYDYLRLGMGYLELPLPDGSMIEAANAVFEDRGNGNLMWTGEVPGAGYESVLFTVQDGHLVGWFGEPGGSKYVVHAGPDGRGSLAEETRPTGDWCGVDAGPVGDLARDGASGAGALPVGADPSRFVEAASPAEPSRSATGSSNPGSPHRPSATTALSLGSRAFMKRQRRCNRASPWSAGTVSPL